MKEADLRRIVSDRKELERRIRQQEGFFRIEKGAPDEAEISGHVEKALWNLNFVADNLKLGYCDWCLTGCYYACYHAAIALLLRRGISTKTHDSALLLLVREYCRRGGGSGLERGDFELVNSLFLGYPDLLFYVGARKQREKATYSSRRMFDAGLADEYRKKAIAFVSKARNLLDPG